MLSKQGYDGLICLSAHSNINLCIQQGCCQEGGDLWLVVPNLSVVLISLLASVQLGHTTEEGRIHRQVSCRPVTVENRTDSEEIVPLTGD